MAKKMQLRLLYTNANGLYNKLSELCLIIEAKNIDIICITETHYHDELDLAEIEIPGYNIFTGNRNFKLDQSTNTGKVSEGGGSVIYVHKDISIVEGSYNQGLDSASVTIHTDIGDILLGCFYRSSSLNDSQNTDFLNYFSSKTAGNVDLEKIIVGDYNCPNVSWLSENVAGPINSTNKEIIVQQKLLVNIHDAGLSWLITDEVTRRRKVGQTIQKSSTIDKIFCSDNSLVSECSVSQPLGKVIMCLL